jgi:hypothetical protein
LRAKNPRYYSTTHDVKKIWAPRRRRRRASVRARLLASVLPALWPVGPGQAALRSGALCRPPWRGAEEGWPYVNNGRCYLHLSSLGLDFRHQRRPLGWRVGRSCCPSQASLDEILRMSCRVSSRAARRPRDLAAPQARRGVQGTSLVRSPGRRCRGPTLPALNPTASAFPEACFGVSERIKIFLFP